MKAASNYPPGVSGNEPEITGIYPPHEVAAYTRAELRRAQMIIVELSGYLEDQGGPEEALDGLAKIELSIREARIDAALDEEEAHDARED